jgi:hypothetical protein
MCYGETAVKPLFRVLYWFLTQDADHPSVKDRFIKVTGKPSIDHERFQVGEWREREDFKINVGLGIDSPEYKQQKAGMLLQVFAAFNQAMSGTTLPNLLPKLYEAFRDQVAALGYNPDQNLMTRQEFQQYYQQLLQQQQQASQQQSQQAQQQQQMQQQVTQMNMQLLQSQIGELQAKIKEQEAKVQKTLADADKSRAESAIAIKQAQSGQLDPAKVVI